MALPEMAVPGADGTESSSRWYKEGQQKAGLYRQPAQRARASGSAWTLQRWSSDEKLAMVSESLEPRKSAS
jgi:hypothetical protein